LPEQPDQFMSPAPPLSSFSFMVERQGMPAIPIALLRLLLGTHDPPVRFVILSFPENRFFFTPPCSFASYFPLLFPPCDNYVECSKKPPPPCLPRGRLFWSFLPFFPIPCFVALFPTIFLLHKSGTPLILAVAIPGAVPPPRYLWPLMTLQLRRPFFLVPRGR